MELDEAFIPGVLAARDTDGALRQLEAALVEAIPLIRHPVALLDGLDRADLATFKRMTTWDVPALRRLGIGVVLISPFQSQETLQHHDVQVQVVEPVPWWRPEGKQFLLNVLRARDDQQLLEAAAAEALATWSAGRLRDLIALARDAGHSAYTRSRDKVLRQDVDDAARSFGLALMRTVSPTMSDRLRVLAPRLRAEGGTNLALEAVDVDMLVRGIITEMPGSPPRYILHPTVAPLLAPKRLVA